MAQDRMDLDWRTGPGETMEHVSAHATDLAAQRRALLASESRFQGVIERNADGILVIAPDGTIRYANSAAIRLLRRPLDSLVKSHFGRPIVPGETTEIDLPFADSETGVAEMRVVATEWEGEPALLATLHDITERNILEARLRQKVQELALADRRKDEFLAMLAHELRNPLAPIRNALHILKGREADCQVVAHTRSIIEQGIQSMIRIIDDLLDVTRVRTGKLHLRPEPVSLASVVEKSLESTRALIEAKEHQITVRLPSTPLTIVVDPVRIEQILVNLLTNAAKYTEPGGVIELLGEVQGNDLTIVVGDNGIGISVEMLDRVFDLFAQADQAVDRALGGLGIGLSLSRRLARMHAGELTAQSDGLGRGSRFTLRIPLSTPPASPTPPLES
jgi:signal transduction histidine kinase